MVKKAHTTAANNRSKKHATRSRRHHCSACGWSFSAAGWNRANYCPCCGSTIKSSSRTKTSQPRQSRKSSAASGNSRHSSRVTHSSVESISASDVSTSRLLVKARHISTFTQQHPWLCSAAGITAGLGVAAAGGTVAAAGAAIIATGGSIATGTIAIGAILGVMAVLNEKPKYFTAGLIVALTGTIAGGLLMTLGSILAGIGVACGTIGVFIAVFTSLPALVKIGHQLWLHRAEIQAALNQVSAKRKKPVVLDMESHQEELQTILHFKGDHV